MNTDNSKEDDIASVCANCGKEGNSDNMNTCNKCKMTKYCNAACKKKHRSKHKKHCERYLAELHNGKLFKKPPLLHEDCPICFLRMPSLYSGYRYYECCGKVICSGCNYAPVYDDQGNEVDNEKCPFCRASFSDSDEELVKNLYERVELNDPLAMYNLGCNYRDGSYGFPQDHTMSIEYYHRAAELGDANAYCCIGYAYNNGEGVEVDKKKAVHYWEQGAIGGDAQARYNLGQVEIRAGNIDRALKHFLIQ